MVRHFHVQIGIVLCVVAITLFPAAGAARASVIVGTNGDDFLFFEGDLQQFTATVVNAYSGLSVDVDLQANVNNSTYDGLGGFDTLFMTNFGGVLQIRNGSGNQTLFSVERIIAGNGDDIINLSDATIQLGDIIIDVGNGDDIIWSNVGNDTLFGRAGNDNIDGGPGNDIIAGGIGNDFLRGGLGDDTFIYFLGHGLDSAFGGDGFDTLEFRSGLTLLDLTLTQIGGPTPGVLIGVGTGSIEATGIEQLRFDDGSTFLIPEPATLSLLALGGIALLRRRR